MMADARLMCASNAPCGMGLPTTKGKERLEAMWLPSEDVD
jgi:hypothetical protein